MPLYLKKSKYWDIVRLTFDWGTEPLTQEAIAKKVGCSQPCVSMTLKRFNGKDSNPLPLSLRSKKQDRRLGQRASTHMIKLVNDIPDLYISEICQRLHDKFHEHYSVPRVCRALKDLNYSYKVLIRLAKERDEQERFHWRETLLHVDTECLVFIDESHFRNDDVVRRRGRSLRGTPAIAVSSLGRFQALSLIAAVTINGMLLPACRSYANGVDHNVLIEWATNFLLPNLPPGSILVLDNASIHHDLDFHDLLKAARKDPSCGLIDFLFLPPYSPDYNPIERCFSQIKRWLRRYQTLAVADVQAAISMACTIITAKNARNYWNSAGALVKTFEEMELEDATKVFSIVLDYACNLEERDVLVSVIRATGRL